MNDDMLAVLSELENLLDRMPGMPWLAWGKMAINMHNQEFLDEIHIAVNMQELTKERKDILNTYWNATENNGVYVGEMLNTPVTIEFINDEMTKNPDTIKYAYSYYRIPNNMSDYVRRFQESTKKQTSKKE